MKGKQVTFILSLLLASALLPLAAVASPRDTNDSSHRAVIFQSQSRSQNPSQSQNESDAKTFTGKITKSNGRYVLEDQSMNSSYYLDDTKAAQKFEGKNVVVTGTLDAQNRTIHVQKIEAA